MPLFSHVESVLMSLDKASVQLFSIRTSILPRFPWPWGWDRGDRLSKPVTELIFHT